MKIAFLVAASVSVALAADPAALLRSGRQAARHGEWGKAETLLSRAEDGARLLDDPSLELAARVARVDLRLAADENDSAVTLLPPLPRRQVAAADSAVWHLASARVHLARGNASQAMTESDMALAAADRAKEKPLRSAAAATQGRARLAQGDVDGARSSWKAARCLADDIPALEAGAALLEARIALASGRSSDAAKAVARSMSSWRAQQDVGGVLAALPLQAEISMRTGDLAAAGESWDALARIAETARLPRVAVRALLQAARSDTSNGQQRRERARTILQQARLDEGSLPPDLQALLR